MRLVRSFDALLPFRLLILLSLVTSSLSHHPRSGHHPRSIVTAAQLQSSYDFVIVGGGTAGLVLASRLSEDANTTVLVLEAGDTGDAEMGIISVPANAYYKSLMGGPDDWSYPVVPQPATNNRAMVWPRGKVLGGSSAVNGMYSVRPSQIEVDAWASLAAPGNDTVWGWDTLFAGMKKSETFVPPGDAVQAADIQFGTGSHGSSGPLYASYPNFIPPLVGSWGPALSAVGVSASPDAYGGQNWGSYVATSSINPTNWTRSYSRSAYIDSLPPRSNLQILTNATVTRLIFNGTSSSGALTASAVEYASDRTSARNTVNVGQEVILSSGAVGSPHILLHSGVGPSDMLNTAGVKVLHELPGVGQHLQDHVSTQVVFNTTSETAASILASGSTASVPGGLTSFLSFVNSATAYVNVTALFGDSAGAFQTAVSGAMESSAASLVPSQDATVVEGYRAIYNVSQQLLSSPLGHVEILLNLIETPAGPQSIGIQIALQRPFSQGYLYINSNNTFDYPLIDPKYLSHDADKQLLRAGAKFARQLGQTAPLSDTLTGEVTPGSAVSSDDDWDNWVAQTIGTEFHPSSTCAMLPLSLGGVVDPDLKVYGLANVRVVDASIFPIQFASHLMAPTYGLAEQAASMIRAEHNAVTSPSSTSSPGSTSSPAQLPKNAAASASTSSIPAICLSLAIYIVIGLVA
ncbi:GMC oxidoreductase [Auriscalpium vulgare]|uniref:GMC oxidoreductase n=1 Tax=Auriscalpium vulgare TaxID=40419 RepID=A0ACB8SC56_9AGAM|nr:GMC oxidoreductase [Auriscalpium vulgare]